MSEVEKAEKRGFVQGVAWAVSIEQRYSLDADQLLHESGLKLRDFVDAGVDGEDLRQVKHAAKVGSVWTR